MLQVLILPLLVAPSLAQPQLPQYDYDYLYEDLLASLDLEQGQASTARPENVSHIAVLKDARYTDPATGAFIYDYMGADGSGKYEVRFLNGTVVGNYTYLNEAGERETRWYSAGTRGTEIAGDGVVSPAPPTLVDETTGANYVDLSNYELYRHLEVPYVHQAGPSDPDERGQLSSPDRRPASPDRRPASPDRRPARPSPVALDHGDITSFSTNLQAAQRRQQQESVFRQHQQQQQQPRQQQQQQQQQPRQHQQQQPRRQQQPRQQQRQPAQVRAPQPQRPQQVRPTSNFNLGAVGGNSPNQVLDSLINQFQ